MANSTNSFIELYNTSPQAVDLSHWTLSLQLAQRVISSRIEIPNGTTLGPNSFYLLGLANSGLAVSARRGEARIMVRNTAGMAAGDTVLIGTGAGAESRQIVSIGTAAADPTTVWQPLPDGLITVPPGSTNIPVQNVASFKVGDKLSMGYGASYPVVDHDRRELYETATVTAVGKPGTQAYLATQAVAGESILQVTSTADISIGDEVRLDIDSPGHGIERVVVRRVGTKASVANLVASVPAGGTTIEVRQAMNLKAGNRITVGTPASQEVVTVLGTRQGLRGRTEVSISPGLTHEHGRDEWVVSPGTGLVLAEPLRFNHAANLPFSDRGTGISFQPATKQPHLSNEPVEALGSGVTLDKPLIRAHDINEPVRDAAVKSAGYQGSSDPNQWFGGPELSIRFLQFGRMIPLGQGSMVLRAADGVVVDSLNYGALVTPWAARGNQAVSGHQHDGCYAPSTVPAENSRNQPSVAAERSVGRSPDGADSGSNCDNFHVRQ